MGITALALSFLAFVAFALAMDRHHGQILDGRPGARFRRSMRLAGAALLCLSAAACVAAYGWSIGLTWWIGILTAAAMPLLLLLTYRPRAIVPMAMACPVIALLPLFSLF
ncbi:MAG: DUF3325 domain-containing protein [Sphingobium sp.]